MMQGVWTVAERELKGYFNTALAFVFIAVFVALSAAFTFYLGGFFERGKADLQPFFAYHPWLYLLLIPALAMRLWAEERKTGTLELLMTLPVSTGAAVVGKFLAAWLFAGLALVLTFPMWVTVNVLGNPDNGVILAGYLGSFLMAGAYLAIGACLSALTSNQVIAFILGAVVCFLFVMSGMDMVLGVFRPWAPDAVVRTVADVSFLTRFDAIARGVLSVPDVVYFLSLMAFWLTANAIAVDQKKA